MEFRSGVMPAWSASIAKPDYSMALVDECGIYVLTRKPPSKGSSKKLASHNSVLASRRPSNSSRNKLASHSSVLASLTTQQADDWQQLNMTALPVINQGTPQQ
jgi:hypothetical protein